MKNKKLFIFVPLILMILLGVGCDGLFQPEESQIGSKKNPINLTINEWTNGEIIKPDNGGIGDQWFNFVATESSQRIYIKLSSITYLNAYLYDSEFSQIGSAFNVQGDDGRVGDYREFSLNIGDTYYIRISGMYLGNYKYSGTYQIGFTNFPAQPETVITELNENIWTNGNVIHPNSGGTGEQWFSFISNDTSQDVQIELDTMTYLNAYLYDKNFYRIGESFNVQRDGIHKKTWSVEKGATYYILVSGNYLDGYRYYTGRYKIAFNNTGEEPL